MTGLPYAWAKAQRILLRRSELGAVLVMCQSTPGWAINEARRQFGPTTLERVDDAQMDGLLAAAYADTGSAAAVVGAAESEADLDRLMQDIPEITDLLDAQDGAPVIRMINALFTQAARDEASDIHIEPYESHSVVRYRVDGTLRDVVSPRKALHGSLCRGSRSWRNWTSPRNVCRRMDESRCGWPDDRSTFVSPRCPPATASAW